MKLKPSYKIGYGIFVGVICFDLLSILFSISLKEVLLLDAAFLTFCLSVFLIIFGIVEFKDEKENAKYQPMQAVQPLEPLTQGFYGPGEEIQETKLL